MHDSITEAVLWAVLHLSQAAVVGLILAFAVVMYNRWK